MNETSVTTPVAERMRERELPTEGLSSRLRGLVQAGETGVGAVSRLHVFLRRAASGPEYEKPALAQVLLELIAHPGFAFAVSAEGERTRVLAVKLLLELGYPWALQVHPDDLSLFREAQTPMWRRSPLKTLLFVACLLFPLVGGAAVLSSISSREPSRETRTLSLAPESARRALGRCYSDTFLLTAEQYERFVRNERRRLGISTYDGIVKELSIEATGAERVLTLCGRLKSQGWDSMSRFED